MFEIIMQIKPENACQVLNSCIFSENVQNIVLTNTNRETQFTRSHSFIQLLYYQKIKMHQVFVDLSLKNAFDNTLSALGNRANKIGPSILECCNMTLHLKKNTDFK